MTHRRLRNVWYRTVVALCLAPFLVTAVPDDAEAGGKKKKDPCDPSYVPAKGETPPTCPGVQEVPLNPAQNQARFAPTPPPVPKKSAPERSAGVERPAVVNSPGFRMTPNGVSKIFVQIHGSPTVHQYTTQQGVTYVLSNARVPVYNNRRPLVTQYFNTPISDTRLRQVKGDVHLQIDLRAPSKPTPKLIELVKGKIVVLEVSFPAGNYYQHIPTSRSRPRGAPAPATRQDPHGGRAAPPGSRGSRSRDTGTRNTVLGPPAP